MTALSTIRRRLRRQAPRALAVLFLTTLALWSTGCICTDPRAGCTVIFRSIPYPTQTPNEFAGCTIVNAPQPCPACLRFEDNGSFESGRMTWQGDQTHRVTRRERLDAANPPDHALPCSYVTMLQMIAATPTGPGADGVGEVYQVIDLRGENLPSPAEVTANALATRINREFSDTAFGFTLEAYTGDPALFPGGNPQLLATHTEVTHTNREAADWEWFSAQLDLPDGADFLVVYVQVFENARNETNGREFFGHYLDGVRVSIGLRDAYDVQVSAEAMPTTVQNSDPVEFRLHVRNNGPNAALGLVAAEITLPVGLVYTGHRGDGAFNPATGIWTVGPLNAEAEAALHLTTAVTAAPRPPDPEHLTVRTRLTSGLSRDPIPGNNTANATVTVIPRNAYDLQLTRTLNAFTFTQGDTARMAFTLTNHGPDSVLQPVFVVGGFGGGLGSLYLVGGASPSDPRFPPPPIPPDSSRTIVEQALAAFPGTYTGIARISRFDLGDGDDPSNNADTLTYTVLPTTVPNDPYLTGVVSRAVVRSDETAYYQFFLLNNGPSLATDLVVQLQLPSGLTTTGLLESPSFPSTYDPVTRQWRLPYLPVGSYAKLSFQYDARDLTPGIHTLTAQIIGGLDRNTEVANDTVSVTVTALPAIPYDLALTKTIDPPVVQVGEEAEFTLILQNNSLGQAPFVAVRDTLPTGLTFLSASTTAYTPSVHHWSPLILLAGMRDTLRIRVRAEAPGTYTNTAFMTAINRSTAPPLGDTNPANNNSSAVLTVQGNAAYDLALAKTSTATTRFLDATASDVVAAGDTLAYTVTVTNAGPGPAGGIVVEDLLPAGLTTDTPTRLLMSPAASQGAATFNDATGTATWTLGALNAGASGTLTLTLRPDAAGGGGPFTNTATITQGLGSDTNAGNNADSVPVSVDLRPIARADTVTTAVNTPIFIDVLANDNDPDGALNATALFLPGGNVSDSGMASVFPPGDGAVEYSPFPGYTGTDTFRYVVRDDQGAVSNEATVTVVVQ